MIDEIIIEKILEQPEFEGFEYEGIIGSGGFATVAKVSIKSDKTYSFRDYELSLVDDYYALKIIDMNEGYLKYKRNKWRGSFNDYKQLKVNPEYEAIKVIPQNKDNFKHIVPIVRHQQITFEDHQYLCLLMPYFPSSSQNNQGRYEDELETVDFALQVSQGLTVMQKYNLIHRDLKPVNILETVQNFKPLYKITDLGGIRKIDENEKIGNTSIILYSKIYTAPECRDGKYSFESDIYALGMCIARFRFNGNDDAFQRMVEGNLAHEIQWPNYYSKGLVNIICKCIQYNPKNRYSSSLEVMKDLEVLKKDLEENSEIANLKKEMEIYKEKIAAHDEVVSKKDNRIRVLLNDIANKENLIEAYAQNNLANMNRIKELDEVVSRQNDEVNGLMKTLNVKQSKIQDLSSEQENNLYRIKELENVVNDQNKKLEELKIALKNTNVENEKALYKANEDKSFFKKKVSDLTKQLDAIKEEYENLLRPKALKENPEYLSMKVGEQYSKELGTYNGKPIEWMVLDKDDQSQSVLLISKDILFNKEFNNQWESVSWQTSSLQYYLNSTFFDQSFSEEEKEKIRITEVKNMGNSKYDTKGDADSKDRVFLLSVEEAKKYFGTNQAMIAKRLDNNSIGSYWLRSPGYNGYNFTRVFNVGGIDEHGYYVDKEDGVRPALWVRL